MNRTTISTKAESSLFTPELIAKKRDQMVVEAKHPEPTEVFEGNPKSDKTSTKKSKKKSKRDSKE